MNQDSLQGKWEQIKGSLHQLWGDLTDDDFAKMKGSQESVMGFLQEKYGESKESLEKKLKGIFKE